MAALLADVRANPREKSVIKEARSIENKQILKMLGFGEPKPTSEMNMIQGFAMPAPKI